MRRFSSPYSDSIRSSSAAAMLLVLLGLAAASRRSASRSRPGSRRASRAASSARTSSARAASDAICSRLNSICCCRRVMSSSQRVNGLARSRSPCASASTSEMRMRLKSDFGFGHRRRRGGLALARVRQARAQRFDPLRRLLIAAGEQQLLPVPQLVAQPLVAARLRRLALERSELLLELEDDVFEARQVQLRGLELQLGRTAPRLVLRDPRGFLDELAPVGRPRAEDHADLALLDDGVGLGAEPGVHQQLVHVAQPAHLAVDQVFALARAIQPPRHFDGPRDRRPVRRPASAGASAAAAQTRQPGAESTSLEPQPHLGGAGRLSRVAAVEDDVFHPVAAQALGALLAEHPRDGVGDVALAASVRARRWR